MPDPSVSRCGVPLNDSLWRGLKPCRECGAPLYADQYPPNRPHGGWWHPDVAMDAYEAINLLEVLKVVPDTGDWHGQLRFRCEQVVKHYGSENLRANATASELRERMGLRA